MKILVINCGSSSIKYKLFDLPESDVLAKGVIEKIGIDGSFIMHAIKSETEVKIEKEIIDHQSGIDFILKLLVDKEFGVLEKIDEIDAAGHRIVHGGEEFHSSVLITRKVIHEIEKCSKLAPLHNPSNLKGIHAMSKLIPGIKQVAVFDTQYHQTMPACAYMYAIPYDYYQKDKIRRYGFHGMSHHYVSNRACEFLNLNIKDLKIISCHLGNGSSITAIKNGVSIDTSMGYTPIEGLIMGTRSGDLDIGVVTHIMEEEKMNQNSVNALLNSRSGMLGITGISSDMREIEAAAKNKNNARAKLALEMYYYRIKKYIGAYVAALNGLDLLIFTGGIGENRSETRRNVCENFDFLGLKLNDNDNNSSHSDDRIISAKDSKVIVIVVPTNEELVIAKDTLQIISNS